MYIALIRQEGRAYGVEFPDFPGCISAGRTLDAAMRGAAEALGLHVRGMVEDGEVIPTPGDLAEVLARPDSAGGVPTLVRLPAVGRGRAVRLNITLEEGLLARIDEAARRRGTNRSAFLAAAAQAAL